MEMDDLVKMKMLEREGMTPYETFKTQHMQTKAHTSGIAVAGIVTGIVGTVAGVTAWIFSPLYANAKASQAREAAQNAKETAAILAQGNQRQLDQLTTLLGAERQERISGDLNITNTINDTVSGQQSGQLSQSQQLSNELTFGLMTGRYSENPQRVALYQDAKPCACPASGCGCGCNG